MVAASLFDPKVSPPHKITDLSNNILATRGYFPAWIRLAPLQRTLVDFANLFFPFSRVPFHEVLDNIGISSVVAERSTSSGKTLSR